MEGLLSDNQTSKQKITSKKSIGAPAHLSNKQNQVGTVMLYGIPIVSLMIESQERLCLAQISNTLLKQYSYNEIHNRRVALGITCMQCTPVQLEILRRAGAMPVSSRRCGMITRREAERLCKSFLGDNAPPRLPDDFSFSVHHECAWGCRGAFLPSRYNSSRAKCIKCTFCGLFFSPNKFIFHSHKTTSNATYVQPDAANFNSWRRHMKLSGSPPDDVVHAWEDVKAMFNGGTRKRLLSSSSGIGTNILSKGLPFEKQATVVSRFQNSSSTARSSTTSSASVFIPSTTFQQIKMETSTTTNSTYPTPSTPLSMPATPKVPPFSDLTLPISMIDYAWHNGISAEGIKHFSFMPYAVPWLENAKRSVLGMSTSSTGASHESMILQQLCASNHSGKIYNHQSAFSPVLPVLRNPETLIMPYTPNNSLKRHICLEESLLPKKRCSRDVEKMKDFDINYLGRGNDNGKCQNVAIIGRCGSLDKENDLKKNLSSGDGGDSYRSIVSGDVFSNYAGSVKLTHRKEYSNDALEQATYDTYRQREKLEKPEMSKRSKLSSLKMTSFDENLFKFREFGPHLLEAISNLQSDEWYRYSDLETETAVEARKSAVETSLKRCAIETEEANPSRSDNDDDDAEDDFGDDGETKRKTSNGVNVNNYEINGKTREVDDDIDDEDNESVDVETTDDPPTEESSIFLIPSMDSKDRDDCRKARIRPEESLPTDQANKKIWALAKFSIGEPDK